MSAQTIKNRSIETLCNQALKSTIDNANKLILKENFKLGKGYCEKEEFHNSIIREMIKVNNKDLVCYINYIIENGPEECKNQNIIKNGL